jgi:hypothetical protein
MSENKYPDTSDILARKSEARREKSTLPFAKKVEIVERLRARVQPIRAAREGRRKSKTE